MRLKGRQRQIYQALEARGSTGLTVIEAMQLGLGTELRKNVTTLIRKGYKINKTWEKKSGILYRDWETNSRVIYFKRATNQRSRVSPQISLSKP